METLAADSPPNPMDQFHILSSPCNSQNADNGQNDDNDENVLIGLLDSKEVDEAPAAQKEAVQTPQSQKHSNYPKMNNRLRQNANEHEKYSWVGHCQFFFHLCPRKDFFRAETRDELIRHVITEVIDSMDNGVLRDFAWQRVGQSANDITALQQLGEIEEKDLPNLDIYWFKHLIEAFKAVLQIGHPVRVLMDKVTDIERNRCRGATDMRRFLECDQQRLEELDVLRRIFQISQQKWILVKQGIELLSRAYSGFRNANDLHDWIVNVLDKRVPLGDMTRNKVANLLSEGCSHRFEAENSDGQDPLQGKLDNMLAGLNIGGGESNRDHRQQPPPRQFMDGPPRDDRRPDPPSRSPDLPGVAPYNRDPRQYDRPYDPRSPHRIYDRRIDTRIDFPSRGGDRSGVYNRTPDTTARYTHHTNDQFGIGRSPHESQGRTPHDAPSRSPYDNYGRSPGRSPPPQQQHSFFRMEDDRSNREPQRHPQGPPDSQRHMQGPPGFAGRPRVESDDYNRGPPPPGLDRTR